MTMPSAFRDLLTVGADLRRQDSLFVDLRALQKGIEALQIQVVEARLVTVGAQLGDGRLGDGMVEAGGDRVCEDHGYVHRQPLTGDGFVESCPQSGRGFSPTALKKV